MPLVYDPRVGAGHNCQKANELPPARNYPDGSVWACGMCGRYWRNGYIDSGFGGDPGWRPVRWYHFLLINRIAESKARAK